MAPLRSSLALHCALRLFCGGALVCVMICAAPLRQADAAESHACETPANERVTSGAPWSCHLALSAGSAYEFTVVQDQLDVSLELRAPDGKSIAKVDSPTKRAGPELICVKPPAAGRYTVIVTSVDHAGAAGIVQLDVRKLGNSVPDVKRTAIGMLVTAGAATKDRASREAGRGELARLGEGRALSDATELGALHAEVLFRIAATHYWLLGNWKEAAESGAAAMRAFASQGDGVMRAQAAVIRAASLIEIAQLDRAGTSRRQESPGRAEFGEAEELLFAAAATFRAAGRRYDEAHALNNAGVTYHYQGRYDEAREQYLAAISIFSTLTEWPSEKLPLQNIAMLDYARGDYPRARGSFESLLARTNPADDPLGYVAILGNVGSVYGATNDLDAALGAHVRALEISRQQKYVAGEARSLHGLGSIYRRAGEYERAETLYRQALALRRAIEDRRGLLGSLQLLGDFERERGDAAAALKLHLEAVELARSPAERAGALLAVSSDHLALGTLGPAFQALRSAQQLQVPDNWPVQIAILGTLGYAQVLAGDGEGRKRIVEAVSAHTRHKSLDLAAYELQRLALADFRAGRLDQAAAAIGQASDLYSMDRVRATNPDLRAAYFASRSAAYSLQAEIELALSRRTPGTAGSHRHELTALTIVEASRQRVLTDLRQLADVPDRALDAGDAQALATLDERLAAKRHRLAAVSEQENPSAQLMDALQRDIEELRAQIDLLEVKRFTGNGDARAVRSKVSVPGLQAALDEDSVALVYLLGDVHSWMWSVTRSEVQVVSLEGREKVEAAARELYGAWSRPPTAAPDTARERELSATILGPAVAALQGKEAVVVVAEGTLQKLPFGALWMKDAASGRTMRLTESHVVSRRSTLATLDGVSGASPAKIAPSAGEILLVGDPLPPREGAVAQAGAAGREDEYERLDSLRFSPLPGSRGEIADIASIASAWHPEVLTGAGATKAAVMGAPLQKFRLIHFATHARADVQDVRLSSLQLSVVGPAGAPADSAMTLREIVRLPLNADLVVLSACEGSLGKDYQGRATFGLAEAFLLAGSRRVLASLWRVADASAREYMRTFYRQYVGSGQTPGVAARSAQLALLRSRQFAHPYFWASFVVHED